MKSCKHPCCDTVCRRPTKPGIKKMSDKRKAENTIYRQKRNAYLKLFPICQVKTHDCTYKATTIHHRAGRIGELLTDETNFLAVCMDCHTAIELNPDWAKRKGYSISRLSDYGDCHSSYPGSEY